MDIDDKFIFTMFIGPNLENFRTIKLFNFDSFRACKASRFESFRALKLSKFANLGCSNFRVRLSSNVESYRVRKYSFWIFTFLGPKTLQSVDF